MKVAVVADLDKSLGFGLAGVNETYTSPEAIKDLMGRVDVAIVFVQEDIVKQLDPRIQRKMQDSTKPAFVQLEGEETNMKQLIKQALGFDIGEA